jgi:hypothetical protein
MQSPTTIGTSPVIGHKRNGHRQRKAAPHIVKSFDKFNKYATGG